MEFSIFHDVNRRSKVDLALDTLRQRICLADPTKELLLHEGALATEFGMSRTPIRQVLQRLSYERLVETKSGVGTVTTPMDLMNRERDLRTHQGILRTVIDHSPGKLSIAKHSDIVALGAIVEASGETDADLHFEVRSRLLSVLSELVEDPILRDAFLAAHWRVIRWHLLTFMKDADAATEALDRLVSSAVQYKGQSALDLLERVLHNDLAP